MLNPCAGPRVLLAEHLVEQRPLVVVEQVHPLRLVEMQQPGQLQHVVAAAVLAGAVAQLAGDHVRGVPVLVVAGAADDVRVVAGDDPPEVRRDVVIAGVPGFLPDPDAGDHLRDVGVRVQAVQVVLAAGQRVEDPGVVEPLRRAQVTLVPGQPVQIGQRLGEPAVLDVQDPLHVRVGEPAGAPADPVAEPGRHLEGPGVPGQLVLVNQPGHELVDHVVGRPDRQARLQPVEEGLRERGQVSVVEPGRAAPRLVPGQLVNQVGALVRGGPVPGVGVGEGQPGHQVPGAVPADQRSGCLPAAARPGRRRQAVVQPERVQHPVRVHEQQVVRVPRLVGPHRAVQQPDRGQRERGAEPGGAVGNISARPVAREGAQPAWEDAAQHGPGRTGADTGEHRPPADRMRGHAPPPEGLPTAAAPG